MEEAGGGGGGGVGPRSGCDFLPFQMGATFVPSFVRSLFPRAGPWPSPTVARPTPHATDCGARGPPLEDAFPDQAS